MHYFTSLYRFVHFTLAKQQSIALSITEFADLLISAFVALVSWGFLKIWMYLEM